eukprot:TRINITY_DN2190_c0_g1_i8.p1 TRINITY_DN2190_c0_g1~~TRINITY_DN2190_c0_g1_i8.p1  ORF type:complete len:569 (-),score=131.81 TRINITY_DN2190_c0_g1_i8:4-1710(-)
MRAVCAPLPPRAARPIPGGGVSAPAPAARSAAAFPVGVAAGGWGVGTAGSGAGGGGSSSSSGSVGAGGELRRHGLYSGEWRDSGGQAASADGFGVAAAGAAAGGGARGGGMPAHAAADAGAVGGAPGGGGFARPVTPVGGGGGINSGGGSYGYWPTPSVDGAVYEAVAPAGAYGNRGLPVNPSAPAYRPQSVNGVAYPLRSASVGPAEVGVGHFGDGSNDLRYSLSYPRSDPVVRSGGGGGACGPIGPSSHRRTASLSAVGAGRGLHFGAAASARDVGASTRALRGRRRAPPCRPTPSAPPCLWRHLRGRATPPGRWRGGHGGDCAAAVGVVGGGPGRVPHSPVHNDLYKTEMCAKYADSLFCRYGSKCQFAHGEAELRVVKRHPKYKTRLCRKFTEAGTCMYGQRCRFIHDSSLVGELAPGGLRLNLGAVLGGPPGALGGRFSPTPPAPASAPVQSGGGAMGGGVFGDANLSGGGGGGGGFGFGVGSGISSVWSPLSAALGATQSSRSPSPPASAPAGAPSSTLSASAPAFPPGNASAYLGGIGAPFSLPSRRPRAPTAETAKAHRG